MDKTRIARIAKKLVALETEKKITIDAKSCPICGKRNRVRVYPSHLEAWKNGELIQNALPELNADERETLKTGICGKCWDEMFKSHK